MTIPDSSLRNGGRAVGFDDDVMSTALEASDQEAVDGTL